MTKNVLSTMLYHHVKTYSFTLIRFALAILPFAYVCQLPAMARKPEVGGQSRKKTFCSS